MRDLISKDWDTNPEMLKGDQLPPSRPAHKPPAVLNKLRSVSERKIALMTDSKPKFDVLPTNAGKGYPEVAKILKEVTDAWWDEECLDQVIARGLYYPINFGAMITKTHWSRSDKEVKLKMVDPRHFVFDPHITNPLDLYKATYVVEEEFPPLDEVKSNFPGQTKDLKPYQQPKSTWTSIKDRFLRGLSGSTVSKERERSDAVDRAWVRHFWLRDYTMTAQTVKNEKGEDEEVFVRKYPGGRYVIVAGEGTILHDDANPYWDCIHPYDIMEWYTDIDTPYGIAEISALKNPQVIYNKIAEVITENGMMMNNGMWICDYNAFDVQGWEQLTNVPGGIIKKRPGTEVRRDVPQGVPAGLMQLLTYLENFIEKEPGINELTGKKPGQVQSGMGIESLQMMAAAPIRKNSRSLESLLQRIGQKYTSRVIQFYTKDRIMWKTGPGNAFTKYDFVRRQFHEAISAEALKDAHKDFRFKVQPGSSLSMAKTSKAMIYLELFKVGAVDRQTLLEILEIPDWENIFKRTMMEQMLGIEGAQQKGKGKKGPSDRKMK